jgi:valyl-tRNA synthetase
MHARYRDWTDKLGLDWCLSRQRYFGVPIPVWYAIDKEGEIDWDRAILPDPESLPVDPMSDTPPGYSAEQRGKPGGFEGEPDIFDTWFTSSLTPQIGSGWGLDAERHARLFPADIRPQSHEIIRTWAFYTIAKALLHEDKVPWHNVLISGWILDPDRKKMSKSQGNVVTPMHLFDEHGVDAVRYWTASARLGTDTAYDVTVFKVGRRLVTKIFNASKFVLAYGGESLPISEELDRAFVHKLRGLVERATHGFDEFNYTAALEETESFFWSDFTDTYLELAKPRAWSNEGASPEQRGSAIATLRLALSVLLRLFAPALPYITEEVWSWAFAEERGEPSIHRALWPSKSELTHVAAPQSELSFDVAVSCLNAINKAKSDASVSTGRVVNDLELACHPDTKLILDGVLQSAAEAARAANYELTADPALEVGVCLVKSASFADAPARKS